MISNSYEPPTSFSFRWYWIRWNVHQPGLYPVEWTMVLEEMPKAPSVPVVGIPQMRLRVPS